MFDIIWRQIRIIIRRVFVSRTDAPPHRLAVDLFFSAHQTHAWSVKQWRKPIVLRLSDSTSHESHIDIIIIIFLSLLFFYLIFFFSLKHNITRLSNIFTLRNPVFYDGWLYSARTIRLVRFNDYWTEYFSIFYAHAILHDRFILTRMTIT